MVKKIKLYHFDSTDEVPQGNVDVEVLLKNEELYSATFFTLENISTIMKSYKKSGECSNGLYFWSLNMIIVEKISEDEVKETVCDLLKTGEFFSVFMKIN